MKKHVNERRRVKGGRGRPLIPLEEPSSAAYGDTGFRASGLERASRLWSLRGSSSNVVGILNEKALRSLPRAFDSRHFVQQQEKIAEDAEVDD